jgi:hypothetical protein
MATYVEPRLALRINPSQEKTKSITTEAQRKKRRKRGFNHKEHEDHEEEILGEERKGRKG